MLQLVVITTHFCVASWMYEGLLRVLGRWSPPIDAGEAKRLLAGDGTLIDVRNPEEFAGGHIEGARNVPLDAVLSDLGHGSGQCLVVYCKSGLRSQRATQLLKRLGHNRVFNLGAMARWEAE